MIELWAAGPTRSTTPDRSDSIGKSPFVAIGKLAAVHAIICATEKPIERTRYLDDDQLDRLLAAVVAEQRRRGKKVPVSDKSPRKALVKMVAPPLPQGKLNAIRAALKLVLRRHGLLDSSEFPSRM